MVKLQILGIGCPNCRRLTQVTETAAGELGIEYVLEKVEDVNDILAMGVMQTPALAVDGKVRIAGRVPGLAELKVLLTKDL